MDQHLRYQLRVYMDDATAALARREPGAPSLQPLSVILERHHAALVNQLDAFAGYVAEAETHGEAEYPLYRWTKATIEDPAKRAKFARTFSIRVHDDEVYDRAPADALEAELRPLVGGGIVERMTRHDTDPAKNPQMPAEYRPA